MITKKRIEDIRFTYEEAYLPTPRCRKYRYRDTEGTCSAEVTLLTEPDKDAPVAFRVHDSRLTQAMGYEYYGENKHRVSKEIRLFNGKLYSREHNGDHYCGGKGWYHYEMFERTFRNARSRYCYAIGKCPNTREECLTAIEESAKNVLLMQHDDGSIGVWSQCGEPRYVFVTFGLGHNHGGTGLFVEQHYNSNIPNTHYYNALERDRAVQAAIDVAVRRGDDQSVETIKMCEEIEVLIPDAVKCMPMRDHGEGDPFMNALYAVTEVADSSSEAAVLAMAVTGKMLADSK